MTSNPSELQQNDNTWQDRQVLVAVTGGIACYKACTLVSKLAQAGASVRVMMTESAKQFVTPLTFQSLSNQPVHSSLWEAMDRPDAQHIGLARWCNLCIIAPATANILAKAATGICDDLVSTVLCALPQATPVVYAPAMNADMWANPITQRNIQTISDLLNWQMVGPEAGWQACRTMGAGRMSEPQAILAQAHQVLTSQ
jgi:phosphopantothenoylcysteine decarboxylase/phosphopantothenate--cysteine ligase